MIDRIDHFVLTVQDVAATCAFYERVLGMEVVTFAGGRKGLGFGQNKINLHQLGKEFVPHAQAPVPGSADFCLITLVPLAEVIKRLEANKVAIAQGPVQKTGALGPMMSVYFRDPDMNLVEVSNYSEPLV